MTNLKRKNKENKRFSDQTNTLIEKVIE